MPMKVEAAIVTQKRPSAAYNTDSVNVNGKVFSRDVIKNGYKGSGVLSGNVFFALTSSGVEGFADAAVAAFNERAEKFPVARDPRSVFSGFFEDCRSALMKMEKHEEELVSACLYASGRKVVLAKNGNVKLYAVRLNVCTPVTPEKVEDTVADYSSSVFPDALAGDIFILLSPGVAELLSEKDIEDICRVSDGSVKKIVSLISKVAFARESKASVSVIAVKVLETAADEELSAVGFVPDFSEITPEEEVSEETSAEINSAEEAEESVSAELQAQKSENGEETQVPETIAADKNEEYAEEISEDTLSDDESAVINNNENADSEDETVSEEETLTEEELIEKKRIKSRLKLLIALSALLVLSVILFAVVLVVRGVGTENNGETTTVTEETTLEETTAEETTSEEETTEEETTEEEALTQAEETTRQSQQSVSRPVSSTTTAPATTAAPLTTQEPASEEETSSEITTAEKEEPSAETTEEPSSEETEETEAPSEEETAAPSEEETESSFSVG